MSGTPIVIQSLDSTSSTNPSTLSLYGTSRQNFIWPRYSGTGALAQQATSPSQLMTLPNGQGKLGFWKMPYQLLVLPSLAWLQSYPTTVTASGTVTAPTETGASFNLELDQNYFSQSGTGVAAISVKSDPLASLGSYYSLTPSSTVPWTLSCLIGAGVNQIVGAYTITVNGVPYVGSLISVINTIQFGVSPYPQFSLAALFQGTLTPPDSCQFSLNQFNLR